MLHKVSSCRLFYRGLSTATTANATAAAVSAAAGENTPPKPHFMAEYLVSSCGFSPGEASKASKHLAHLRSTQKPESFLSFLRSHGFDETHLRKLVSWNPKWLCSNVEKNLAPKFSALQQLGFSASDLTQLILANPTLLSRSLHRTVIPRLEFWRGLVGSNEHLLTLAKNGGWFLYASVENTVVPNLALLRECGVEDERIALLVRKNPLFLLRPPESFRAMADWVEEMGVPRSSGMFMWALWAVHLVGRAKFDTRLRLMRSLGWSETEFYAAFRKAPLFVSVSDMMLLAKMDFLVKEAGYEPSKVAVHPKLLMYSLEKRLVPRFHAMQMLKAKGLLDEKQKLMSLMNHSEKVFMEKYILRYKEQVMGLAETYKAAVGGVVPIVS